MTNIYVGNLSYEATEDDIRQAFEAHGEVSSVSIIMDKMTGRSRGFGFVEMPEKTQAAAAISALNLQEIRRRRSRPGHHHRRRPRPSAAAAVMAAAVAAAAV